MIYFLEIDDVIKLHKALIVKFGGLAGLRDRNLLESALVYPQLLFSMKKEQDIYILGGAYCYHLIANHPFVDGNKRIGVLAMLTFFKMNGFDLHIENDKLYDFAMDIAMSKIAEDRVAQILKTIALKN